MLNFIAETLRTLADKMTKKSDASPSRSQPEYIDAHKKHKSPSKMELLAELKNTAWTCASINAAVCASHPPKLYVRTKSGQPKAKCQTKAVKKDNHLAVHLKGYTTVEEVTEHPILQLIDSVNPAMNSLDMLEITQLYQESMGLAYWWVEMDKVLGIPMCLWVLPTQYVTPRRNPDSPNIIDYYEYTADNKVYKYKPEEIIAFRFPNPYDPYREGLSPLRACFEQTALISQYVAMKRAIYDNTGVPSVLLSPDEVIGEDEARRLEAEWNQKFRKGGMGKAMVSESAMKMQILSHSMGDLAALAEAKATKEDIANAFHVPIAYLSGETNLANMEASEIFHMRLAITPRLRRRDEKLNEQLIPFYDQTGRLFLASEDPTPTNKENLLKQEELDLRMGVRSINEVRIERGLPPVPWGETPIMNNGGIPGGKNNEDAKNKRPE